MSPTAINIDIKTFKFAYIILAFLVTLCAIVAAYFNQQYITLGLIVLASAIMLVGSMLLSYMYKIEKAEELKKI